MKNKIDKRKLRIYYLVMESPNSAALPASKIWHNNLCLSLKKNHEVVPPCFSPLEQYELCSGEVRDKMSPSRAREYFSEMLYKDIKRKHQEKKIDLFFSYLYSFCVLPQTIEAIKKLGIKTVNFFCNSAHQFHLVEEIAPHYDYSMFVEKEAEQKYRAVGANPVYIQEGANPDFYKPYNLKKVYDVTFVGQNYLNRSEYIRYLYDNGIKVRVWGPYWISKYKKWTAKYYLKKLRDRYIKKHRFVKLPKSIIGPTLSDDELVKMFSRSKISIGFSEVIVQSGKNKGKIKTHIRLRDFEAPMSGAFYMVGHQKELEDFYDIGREIVTYTTKIDLLEKVRYYLKHKEERERIRKAGYRRALRDHTWEKRFEELFAKIGL